MKKITCVVATVLLFPFFCSASNGFEMRLEHRLSNLETENSYLKQKIQNQEATLDSLREEITALIRATKEVSDKSSTSSESKLSKLEKNLEKLLTDMKQFKTHANETSEALAKQQKTLEEFEETSSSSKKQFKEFEEALKSLAKAMSLHPGQENIVTQKGKAQYKVQPGDSLGKIAKNFGKSISALREINKLKSDTIVPGQEIIIPD